LLEAVSAPSSPAERLPAPPEDVKRWLAGWSGDSGVGMQPELTV
jgi:hypothetical protein